VNALQESRQWGSCHIGREEHLPIREHVSGALACIFKYERVGGRCPACDFLHGLDSKARKKFAGQFDALVKTGKSYINQQRFKPLIGAGKPLWEFKEFDYRLYCYRHVDGARVMIVLFSGWIKEKEGRTDRENREITRAQNLCAEFLSEYPGGAI
jgi:hypothetical protein